MPIISLSLNDKIIDELDYLQKQLGYSGRSEIVRAAIRSFLSEKENEKLLEKDEKIFSGSLTITSPEHGKDTIHTATKGFENIIKTQIHQCLSSDKCMSIFVLQGKGKKIKGFIHALERLPKIENVKLVLAV